MMSLPLVLSFLCGFLSLSQEILWVRLVSFALHSTPQGFGFVLGLYLWGIALGALAGKRLCQQQGRNLVMAAGWLLLSSMIFDCVAPALCVAVMRSHFGMLMLIPAIVLSAAIRAAAFPIVHHLGSQNSRKVGSSISNVYCANVMGATLGPLMTGFFLLDWVDLQAAMLLINLITGLTGAACLLREKALRPALAGSLLTGAVAALLLAPETLITSLIRNDHIGAVNHIIQNRHGIIHTYAKSTGDIVFGANVYDGTVNTDLHINSNGINRAYLVPALVPEARRVLVIGLSSGSWVRILTAIPSVTSIDVVEINPGYLDLVGAYPQVAPLFKDPRVHIHIDDGRRWLNRHPDSRFDLVLMNTSWHWRSYTTNLVSQDFLLSVKQHLSPGGVLYFNSTGSNDIFFTASRVFAHSYRYANFIAASDRDVLPGLSASTLAHTLANLEWPDTQKPVFDFSTEPDRQLISRIMSIPLLSVAHYQQASRRPFELVTDQNMITEYKYGLGQPQ